MRHSMRANLLDLIAERSYFGELTIDEGRIAAITELGAARPGARYLLPGFIDAHVHIESSLLPPAEFGRIAARHGTVAVVADPHEVANVLGLDGVQEMLASARQSPFHLFFGAPSCVPATPFESAGGVLRAPEIATLLQEPEVVCLAEMMNFPGVLAGDGEVMAKLAAARVAGVVVDGHAPGLSGEAAGRYIAAGISTDHECTTLAEAREKAQLGMYILIREGSAARDFDTLLPLLRDYPEQVMFCSDDKHPDDLVAGHIDRLVARAVAAGYPLWQVLRAACLNPVRHYQLPVGLLREGDRFDAIAVDDLSTFRVAATWIGGHLVAEAGHSSLPHRPEQGDNRFAARPITLADLDVVAEGESVRAIVVADGSLVTQARPMRPLRRDGRLLPDPAQDLLLACVLNRYAPAAPAVGFVHGFGLRHGAIASSVAHDSHNVVAVGVDGAALCRAVNAVVAAQGGLAVADDDGVALLALPFAGLMSLLPGDEVASRYQQLDSAAHALGSPLRAPFMTLSFLALLVIPELKLSDRGLFDGRRFQFVDLVLSAPSDA